MNHRRTRVASGFTLIELLVVIAIIAILAAILFPVFAQARSKARQASGLSNIRQVTLAIIQYNQDYDETFPRAGWDCAGPVTGRDLDTPSTFPANGHNGCGATAWQNITSAYHKNSGIFTSPGDASTSGNFSTTSDGNFSVLFNDMLSHELGVTNGFSDPNGKQAHFASGGALAKINAPADCVLLAEGHCGWDDKASTSGTPEDQASPLWNGAKWGLNSNGKVASKWYREQTISGFQSFLLAGKSYGDWGQRVTGAPFYNGGGNVGFTDGHAKFVRMADQSGNPILRNTLPWIKNMDPAQVGLANSKTGDEGANGGAAGWQ